jgi:uncharacterized coiled-coil DUF342 family protein
LSSDFIVELEEKIDTLIALYQQEKKDGDTLREKIKTQSNRIGELEAQSRNLADEVESLKSGLADRQQKLDLAADRVQGILKKLEAVG